MNWHFEKALDVLRKRYVRQVFAAALRIAPLLCILAIAILSLVPGRLRPHTGLPGQAEHFLAYFITGLLSGFQVRNLTYYGTLALALCAYAGILETLQIWIPGRSSQLIDFLASSSGALSGIILSAFFLLSNIGRRVSDIGGGQSRGARFPEDGGIVPPKRGE